VAEEEERHARGFLEETSPSGKATMTIAEFCEQRFLRYHAVGPGTRQEYGYTAKNHIVPYVGHLRISEVNRETFFNLHPLHALTTYELRDYRRQLENAVAFFDQQTPVPAVRDDVQATLDAVTAEQESRERLTRA
jgi:hypothetical protein